MIYNHKTKAYAEGICREQQPVKGKTMGEKIRDKNTINNKQRVIIIAICLACFFVMLWLARSGNASVIDDPAREAIYSLRSSWLTPIMKAITYLGNWQTITAICLVLLAFRKTRITYGVPLSIGAIIVTVLNNILKSLVERPRPDEIYHLIEQGGWSFPSGHSITSMFFFGMLIWLVRRNVQNRRSANTLIVLLAIPMLLIGVSRVYLGVHYPTDVLAGWCLGVVTIVFISWLVTLFSTIVYSGSK